MEKKKKWNILDKQSMNKKVRELLAEIDVSIDVHTKVSELPIVLRQMVASVKAIVHEAKILIMDEPSSSLTNKELEVLFNLIRKLKNQNITIIYVSHLLEEIFQICDSVTVLFNGRVISTDAVSAVTKAQVIEKMVGRKVVETRLNTRKQLDAPFILEAEGVSFRNILDSVSFKVKKGEIYGILGLVGSGVADLGKILYGIRQPDLGTILLNGKAVSLASPSDALENSISYVSDDRRAMGVFLEMSAEDNGTMAALDKFLNTKFLQLLDRKAKRNKMEEYVTKFHIKVSSINQYIRYLSGGNQQKLMIARALISDTEIIILNSPTKGIDVGAKFDIYQILLNCIAEGKTIIVISQEITELVQICDRVLMLKKGKVFKEYGGENVSENLIYTDLLN
jgi:ABC-type sugar transport system ATPase subunit